MLRTSLFLALTAAAGLAMAQSSSTAQSQTRPSSAPPANVAPIEAGSDQPVTVIPDRPRTRITEKKAEGGQVTEVEVQSGKSHYKLRPNAPAGNAQPGTVEAGSTRAPLWTVKEFDILGKKKKEGAAEASDSGSNANAQPPAPPAATSQPPAANTR
jgi:hypothetical protein